MIKAGIRQLANRMGYNITRQGSNLARDERSIVKKVKGLTATSPERIVGLMDAVKYITANKINGAIVECGVWRGGSIMAAAYTLLELGDTSREIYLFDTFEGMTPPTDRDRLVDGTLAEKILARSERSDGADSYWCMAGLETVRKNVLATGYPEEKIHFIQGRVEDTLPQQAPDSIAILRLDTDWYESTRHELVHLYPRLVLHGVLIIDDYGHWLGARRAADEFFAAQPLCPFLTRLDYTGRLIIKTVVHSNPIS